MNFNRFITLVALVMGLSVSVSAGADSHEHEHEDGNNHSNNIGIMNSWIRLSPPGAPSAGFMMIHNMAEEDDTLISVSGDFANRIEIHKSSELDGMMSMVHQEDGVVIPASGFIEFKTGSYHIMNMGLHQTAKKGDVHIVVLTFKNAGNIKVEFPVMEMPMAGHVHTDMDH